ncbi:MAG: sugar phosphate nucleotidyltransferase [Nitrososphaerota archaeon]
MLPAAGLGTRLLPITKELPKEMLPIFVRSVNDGLCLKPMIQAIFEQLYDFGFREFVIIVGRGKRAIEDHFTPDKGFIELLKMKNKHSMAVELESFYNKILTSNIVFVNQPEPRGFGDAVLAARSVVNDPFLLHAGDTYIISKNDEHLKRLFDVHKKFGADTTILIQEIEDPRAYGVIEGKEVSEGVILVESLEEKPEKPRTNLAIMPVYIFDPVIFKALEIIKPGKGGEIQLTDAIQKLVDWGLKVYAVKLKQDEQRLDIGTPQTCWESLMLSYNYFKKE